MKGEKQPSPFDGPGKVRAKEHIQGLATRRKAVGLSQSSLAVMLGCTQGYIAFIEGGRTSVSLTLAFAMEAAIHYIELNGIEAAPVVSKRRNPIGPPAPAGRSRNYLSKQPG